MEGGGDARHKGALSRQGRRHITHDERERPLALRPFFREFASLRKSGRAASLKGTIRDGPSTRLAWVEMREVAASRRAGAGSPSVRRAWVETRRPSPPPRRSRASPSAQRARIEMSRAILRSRSPCALLSARVRLMLKHADLRPQSAESRKACGSSGHSTCHARLGPISVTLAARGITRFLCPGISDANEHFPAAPRTLEPSRRGPSATPAACEAPHVGMERTAVRRQPCNLAHARG